MTNWLQFGLCFGTGVNICGTQEYVRLNVSHLTRGSSAERQAGQIHRRKTLFGEIGFPDTVEKISSSAAIRPVRVFHAASNCSAASGKGIDRRLATVFGSSNTPS